MPALIVVKGNRCKPLPKVNGKPTGFELYTGPEGEETLETSYCGTRKAEYKNDMYPNLKRVEQLQPDCPWDCWYLTTEETPAIPPKVPGADEYPQEQGQTSSDPLVNTSKKKERKKK